MKRVDWTLVGYLSIPALAMALMLTLSLFLGGCEFDPDISRKGEVPDGVPEQCWRMTDLQLRRNCENTMVVNGNDGGAHD